MNPASPFQQSSSSGRNKGTEPNGSPKPIDAEHNPADAPAVPAGEAGQEDAGVPFSILDLQDRVVIRMLYDEVIGIEHVEKAWYRWSKYAQAGKRPPLWRMLLEDPDLEKETVFSKAAKAYDFSPVEYSKLSMLGYLRARKDRFTKAQWKQLARLYVVPVGEIKEEKDDESTLVFITHDVVRPELHRYLGELNIRRFALRYAPQTMTVSLITQMLRDDNGVIEQQLAYDLGMSFEKEDTLVDETALDAEINRSALLSLFESMLTEAVRQGASDIHIVPNSDRKIEIVLRIDGTLRLWHTEERIHPESFLAIIKDNAMNVDRFVRDKAQDGFIQRYIDDTLIRFRVSVLPVVNVRLDMRSESVVIRILDDRKVIKDLKALGLEEIALNNFNWALEQPYGMVVLTGPTGSGKSTTLYAALNQITTPELNVLSVEDPVEYVLSRVRQIKLSHNLSLEQALRSILRHDPDVVMIGEMRDRETAELAIKLANTGHLTLSTLHTNDAPSAISRLFKMGIEPFLISYAINLVVAQRLMRLLCPRCKKDAPTPDPTLLKRMGFSSKEIKETKFYEPGFKSECPTCHGSGYKGRRAITETLPFTPSIRQIIIDASDNIDEGTIRAQAMKEGMTPLDASARALILEGVTSMQEMTRVVYTKL
jgi:type IV pilus assembly protein PilB